MSKSLGFMDKVRLFIRYLNSQKDGVIVDCAFCKSIDIKYHNSEVSKPSNYPQHLVYFSDYTCNQCGATCENKQVWNKKS